MLEQRRRSGEPRVGTGRRRSGWWVLAFAGWTLFVWGGRLRNVVEDDTADAVGWSLVGSVIFVVLAVVVAALWLTARRRAGVPARAVGAAVGSLALLTVGVWLVRGVDIALGDHSVGFIAVHLVLAVVSIGLAVTAVLAVPAALVGARGRYHRADG